ncbi:MAG TPA: 6,7-dimethyl-8-ribityllumazine synthase [Gammaproteobacteria bacterium]|nr:6,7-dimethyl-8-ribityllumazine synthase [Gammaproteobacteria bacterium]
MSDFTPDSDRDLHVADARIAIVASRFNDFIVNGLVAGAHRMLKRHGIADDAIELLYVPGAFEIPLAAKKLAERGRCDGVIALGAVIRGDTAHFEFVAGECTRGLGQVMLETGLPIGFGVLTCDTDAQAMERSNSKQGNKGEEAALAVLEMVAVLRGLDDSPSPQPSP